MSQEQKKREDAMRIFQALSGVDEELLARCEESTTFFVPKRKRPIRYYGSLAAACLCMVIVGAAVWQNGISWFTLRSDIAEEIEVSQEPSGDMTMEAPGDNSHALEETKAPDSDMSAEEIGEQGGEAADNPEKVEPSEDVEKPDDVVNVDETNAPGEGEADNLDSSKSEGGNNQDGVGEADNQGSAGETGNQSGAGETGNQNGAGETGNQNGAGETGNQSGAGETGNQNGAGTTDSSNGQDGVGNTGEDSGAEGDTSSGEDGNQPDTMLPEPPEDDPPSGDVGDSGEPPIAGDDDIPGGSFGDSVSGGDAVPEPDIPFFGDAEVEWITMTDARAMEGVNDYIPYSFPVGYSFSIGAKSVNEETDEWQKVMLIWRNNNGYECVLQISRADMENVALTDVTKPETYNVHLYNAPYEETVPQEYQANFNNPIFAEKDFSLGAVQLRMKIEEGSGEYVVPEGNFSVLYDSGIMMTFNGTGDAQSVYEMFMSTRYLNPIN